MMKHRKVLVSISSFPVEASPNKPRFIDAMEKYNINYTVEEKLWGDLGGFNPSVDDSVEALKIRLANCYSRGCHNLSNGEYHICPGRFMARLWDSLNRTTLDKVIIRGRKDHQAVRKELQALRNKEYIQACGTCSGTLEENVIPGIQLIHAIYKTSRKEEILMHNLVIFTASYIIDLDRLEILKTSVDKFNADKIPFYIVVPQKDLETIKNKIVTGNESYELKFITDEEVLHSQNEQTDGWRKQQVKKLAFGDLGISNFYTIIDSDIYFIQDFHVSDFMRDENTPYLSIREVFQAQDKSFAKNYFNRTGKNYTFVRLGQVFSRFVLEDMKKNVLEKNGMCWNDLIKLSPWEFQWYGEYYLKCQNS